MNTEYFAGAGVTLHHGDCIEVMRTIPDASVDAVVTDPPYGLEFMGRAWDGWDTPQAFEAWCAEWATEARRILKPGGHLLAFGGSRTWHRLAAGIEDAGFEVRDSIAWLYGSGFPKSMDVATAIDKLDASAERRERALEFTAWMREHLDAQQINAITGTVMGSHYVTDKEQPSIATPELFDILRPHLPEVPERIEVLVADRVVESENWAAREVTGQHHRPAAAQEWRAGLDGTRVAPARERRDIAYTPEAQKWEGWGTALKPAFEPIVVARKPLAGTVASNVLAHGTGALNIDATRTETGDVWAGTRRTALGMMNDDGWKPSEQLIEQHPGGRWPTNVLLDESQAAALDEQTGTLKSGMMRAGQPRQGKASDILGAFAPDTVRNDTYGDEGGASRFFPTFRYEAKAPTSERPNVDGVQHPTVKPLDLMRWLCRLVTPAGGTILEPFAGSGTTLEAALLEGFQVIGIEREADYLPLIVQRITKPLQVSLFGDWDEGAA